MAFVISQSEYFTYPVTLPKLNDNGSVSRHEIKVKFKRLPSDEAQAFNIKDFDPVVYAEVMEQANGDKDLANILMFADGVKSGRLNKRVSEMAEELMQIMHGWSDVSDESGPLEFDRPNLEKLLQFTGPAYSAIKEAFREATTWDGKKKN